MRAVHAHIRPKKTQKKTRDKFASTPLGSKYGWEVSQLTYLETSQPGFHQKVVEVSYFAVFPTKNGILCGIGVVPKFVLVGNLLFSVPKCQ